jgi:hypothetical protein
VNSDADMTMTSVSLLAWPRRDSFDLRYYHLGNVNKAYHIPNRRPGPRAPSYKQINGVFCLPLALSFHLPRLTSGGDHYKVWRTMSAWIGGRLDKRILPVNQVLYRAFDLIWQWQVFSKRTTAMLVFVGRVPVRWIPFAGYAAEFEYFYYGHFRLFHFIYLKAD